MPAFLTDSEIKDFRLRLCEEAERQFVELGVAEVSMRSLAKALGCSATTPYTYFENKEEIVAEVRAAILNRVCATLEEIATRGLAAAQWAREHTRAFLDFAFKEPNAYRLVYDLDLPDSAKYLSLKKANARSVQVRTAYVEKLIAEGYVQGDAVTLGYLYFAAMHGLIMLRMTGRPASSPEEFNQTCQAMLKLITRGARESSDLALNLGTESNPSIRQKKTAQQGKKNAPPSPALKSQRAQRAQERLAGTKARNEHS